MICGALQTLNEEAFEDVASSERPSPSGLPTGEMLAAAAQLQLAPIRESSEFGSPSDEQKIHNLLRYNINNNNNNNNDYNRSASSHSLQSLNAGGAAGGGLQMRMGNGNSSADLINVGGGGGGGAGSMFYNQHSLAHGARPSSIADELLIEPMTPYSQVPTVVVVPNSDQVYDDTKL